MPVARTAYRWVKVALMLSAVLSPHACRNFAAFAPEDSRQAANGGDPGVDPDKDEPVAGGSGGAPEDSSGEASAGVGGQSEAPESIGGASGSANASVVSKDPSEFDRLSFWLLASGEDCARDGAEHVVQWRDRSDNHNDANAEGSRPMPSLVDDVLAGHAVVHFEPLRQIGMPDVPSSLTVTDSNSVQLGREDFTYAIVARWNNSVQPLGAPVSYTGAGSILSKHEQFLPFRGVEVIANYPSAVAAGTAYSKLALQLELGGALALSSSDHLNDGTFRVYVARRARTLLQVRINGAFEGSGSVDASLDASAEDRNLYIGGVDTQPFSGDIAEIVAIKGPTTDEDLAGLERHLMDKYALD